VQRLPYEAQAKLTREHAARITNYYRNPDPDPPLNGLTPRQYLHGKSFDERYQFGIDVLRRKFGVLK